MNFKLIKSDTIFQGKVFDLQIDEIEYDSGNKGIREVAIHSGGSVIVALTDDYKIVLVNQFRYPFQRFLYELPAGKLEKGEDPQVCALRELKEETGYKAKSIIKLGTIVTTPGFCTERLHIFLAQGLSNGEHNREEGEFGMQIIEITLKEIEDKIKNGDIYDAKTISGIMLAKLHLTKS
ncbi:MAG: NUDIX hydrolase [Ignavibacteria bacterium]|jgi:ADP-ribose pyrophosphatase|nr:NUDIX hydrolase [Ignavibacteria bacterium]MDP3830115.1 NUDIX hydrolase [Ignavibacteriaceae bacterium]